MAWSYGGLNVKEMTDPMIQGAIDELQAEQAHREPCHEAEGERRHWTQYNDGASTSFYSCGKCGASVQPQDRETHVEWHREHGR